MALHPTPFLADNDPMATARRRVKPLHPALEGLTTKRLLAYRSKLYSLETLEGSDIDASEVAQLDSTYIYFQDSPEWLKAHVMLKSVLDQREHVRR